MGEVLACLEFARRLKAEFPRRGFSYLLRHWRDGRRRSRNWPGSRMACGSLRWITFRWCGGCCARLKPSLVIVAETEIWPNLFREVHRTGAGLAIVNGRISDKALPKYLRMRWVFPVVLAAVDRILAQTEEMAGSVPAHRRASRCGWAET